MMDNFRKRYFSVDNSEIIYLKINQKISLSLSLSLSLFLSLSLSLSLSLTLSLSLCFSLSVFQSFSHCKSTFANQRLL